MFNEKDKTTIKSYFTTRVRCPACKSNKTKTLYRCSFQEPPLKDYLRSYYSDRTQFEYLKGADFVLEECTDCGLVYQKNIPDESLAKLLYEEWIHPDETRLWTIYQTDLRYFSRYAQEIMMVIAYLNTQPGKLEFLDFGMGWGSWCRMAKAFGCDCYGTELSQTRIEYVKSQGVKVISWDDASEHRFDFINTDQVFEHLPEPFETLMHLKKSLKPEGLLKINTPNGADIRRRLKAFDWNAPRDTRNSLHMVAPLEHINCFNRGSVIKMADMAGLELVNIPLKIQYAFTTHWSPLKEALKNCIRPLYRDVLHRGNYLYLFFRTKGRF